MRKLKFGPSFPNNKKNHYKKCSSIAVRKRIKLKLLGFSKNIPILFRKIKDKKSKTQRSELMK